MRNVVFVLVFVPLFLVSALVLVLGSAIVLLLLLLFILPLSLPFLFSYSSSSSSSTTSCHFEQPKYYSRLSIASETRAPSCTMSHLGTVSDLVALCLAERSCVGNSAHVNCSLYCDLSP